MPVTGLVRETMDGKVTRALVARSKVGAHDEEGPLPALPEKGGPGATEVGRSTRVARRWARAIS